MNNKVENIFIKWRVVLILIGFVLVAIIILHRLYTLQIIQGEKYREKANAQHTVKNDETFDRGSIFFQDKDGKLISAATLESGFTISISPNVIIHPEDVYNNLGLFLDIDEDYYINRAYKENDPYEIIAKRVPFETGQKIKDLRMIGVQSTPEKWRYYPANNLASQTIGFVAFRDDELRGQYGLERYYDDILVRKNQSAFRNFFIEIFSTDKIEKNNDDLVSIVTTIDPNIQFLLQEEVNKTFKKWGSKNVGAIIMDSVTGKIIGMSQSPNFNLNEFNLVSDTSLYQNKLVSDVYEFGSVFKPLTVAIGLDTGAINLDLNFYDTGSLTLNTETIFNHDKKARGYVGIQEIINNSLNTGVAHIVSKTGNKLFADYAKKLIGEKTDIDLPNEANPIISNLNSKNDIEYATASYGQGIAMSAVSITRALSTLANGGKLVNPHIVEKIVNDETGEIVKNITEEKIKNQKQIFQRETTEEVTKILVNAVDEALLGGSAAMKNYSIAAKTGTAQIAKTSDAGYYDDRTLHSFFGYFPAHDPKFIIFIYQIEPKNARYASDTLVDPFMNIVKYLINYYNIPSDRNINSTSNKNID